MPDELGAHVSSAGGVDRAPGRAAQLDSVVLQLFTKQPSRWAEPVLDEETVRRFGAARAEHGIVAAATHDSYLINLASPDPVLHERSYASFVAELRRCEALGIELLVTHPGHATDGDVDAALARNAGAITRALDEVNGAVHVLLETTAGSGRALGASFEQLGAMIERIAPAQRARVGVCLDTCHVWAAGYDIASDYGGVMRRFDDAIGCDRLRLFHLNDSIGGLGSRRDRHADIGEGALGEAPFRSLLDDPRFATVPKLLETPKGDDAVANDRRNLGRLRALRSQGGKASRRRRR
jgi:deoxyribonuclease IV